MTGILSLAPLSLARCSGPIRSLRGKSSAFESLCEWAPLRTRGSLLAIARRASLAEAEDCCLTVADTSNDIAPLALVEVNKS